MSPMVYRHRVGARFGAELLHFATFRMCARERSADPVGGLPGVGEEKERKSIREPGGIPVVRPPSAR